MTLSLVFPNYSIRSYLNRTLSLKIILSPSYRNMGLCRPPIGLPSHLGHVAWVRILDSPLYTKPIVWILISSMFFSSDIRCGG
jgi:hypothetical protein